MKVKLIALLSLVTIVLTLSYTHSAFAVSTLTVSSSGKGGFVLQGNSMDGVAAMDITITYDTATLANPRVVQGGLIAGALMAVNTTVPGAVRMGIITTSFIKGSGTIVTLAFDPVGASPGQLIAIKASIANRSGSPLPVDAQILNAAEKSVTASAGTSTQGTPSDQNVPSAPVGQQVVIGVPAPLSGPAVTALEEPAPIPAPEKLSEPAKEPAVVSQVTPSSVPGTEQAVKPIAEEKKIYKQKSVLDHFREFKGEQSEKAFVALFDQEPLIGFRQDPPIALSDGKTVVNVSFIAMTSGANKPDIALKGSTLVSLKKDPDNTNTWIAEIRPDKKTVSATLVVSRDKGAMEFPIVVAPPAVVDLDKSGTVTEADFKEFLRDRGTSKKPEHDLNGDGKRDFVDDYIFTANYIIKKKVIAK